MSEEADFQNEQELIEAFDTYAALQEASGEEYDMDAIMRFDEEDDDEGEDDGELENVDVLHRGKFVPMKKLKQEEQVLKTAETKYEDYLLHQGSHLLFIRDVEKQFCALLDNPKETTIMFKSLEPYYRRIIHTYAKKFLFATMSEQLNKKKVHFV